ncbi:hypothetical protein HAT91_02341 [Dickeya solani]|nr:hypothetical protein HAT91_02341 [Dickeya solani]
MTNSTNNIIVFVHSSHNIIEFSIIYKIPHRTMTTDEQNRRIF